MNHSTVECEASIFRDLVLLYLLRYHQLAAYTTGVILIKGTCMLGIQVSTSQALHY